MELEAQFITDNNLSTEQVTAITTHVSTLEETWKGTANTNAERILDGAAEAVRKGAGLEIVRGESEKITDYFARLGTESIAGKQAGITKLENEWGTKLKDFQGNDALKLENEQLVLDRDTFKQKAADFDDWQAKDYKGIAETSSNELISLKRSMAFDSAKPSFPDTVNSYEADAKWKAFMSETLDVYDVHLDENNKPILKDKVNDLKIIKLSDLVSKNKDISELLKSVKTPGFGGKPSDLKIEGVPFPVSDNMSSGERQGKIKEYLTGTLNLPVMSTEYAQKFAELNQKLMGGTPK